MIGQRPITTVEIFKNQAISALGTITQSGSVDLVNSAQQGIFSVYIQLDKVVASTPIVKLRVLNSWDGINFYRATDNYEVIAGFSTSSGTNGKDFLSVTPVLSRYIKFEVEETNDDVGVVSLVLNIQ